MTMRSKSQRLKEGMALREEMSRDGGSTGMTSSSSLVAKELDVVNVTLSLFEGQRSPTKLNNEVKVGETMNHPRVSSSPTGPSSSAKISQVFSEALRQDREDAEGDDDSDKALAQMRGGAKGVNLPAQMVTIVKRNPRKIGKSMKKNCFTARL
ncbi:hypothetical protein U1Q18_002841 [Sarracenia purpurea var. burkii]